MTSEISDFKQIAQENLMVLDDHFINQNTDEEIQNIEKMADENDDNSLESKLNPTAKEFVPMRSHPTSPEVPSGSPNLLMLDDVVAQSPRKGLGMDNINLPTETEFDTEISCRPHELESSDDFMNLENGEALNSKEASNFDEKLDDDYKVDGNELLATVPPNLISFDRFNEPNAMNESFYEENTKEDLNKIQPLPVNEDNDELLCFDNQLTENKDSGCLGQPSKIESATQHLANELNNLLIEAESLTDRNAVYELVTEKNLTALNTEHHTSALSQNVNILTNEVNTITDTNHVTVDIHSIQHVPDLLIPETSVDTPIIPNLFGVGLAIKEDKHVEENKTSSILSPASESHLDENVIPHDPLIDENKESLKPETVPKNIEEQNINEQDLFQVNQIVKVVVKDGEQPTKIKNEEPTMKSIPDVVPKQAKISENIALKGKVSAPKGKIMTNKDPSKPLSSKPGSASVEKEGKKLIRPTSAVSNTISSRQVSTAPKKLINGDAKNAQSNPISKINLSSMKTTVPRITKSTLKPIPR